MVNLLELAITFIERLETHLETIRNIPHLDANLKKMVSISIGIFSFSSLLVES
jgi:hypothetical protein